MKKLSNLFLSVTLCSVVLTTTACGKKANLVTPDFPQQQATQPVAQYPSNESSLTNPAYQNQQSSYDYQNQTEQQNTPSSPNLNNNSTYNPNTSPSNQNMSTTPETVPTAQPSSPAVKTPTTPVKTPWYKKVINKVKSIFSKKPA